jgi:threonine aldolase
MGNLVCLLTHCDRAQEVILGSRSHTFHFERGGMAALAGVHARTIENEPDGTLDLNKIKSAINTSHHMFAPTRMICLENTWNGHILHKEYVQSVRQIASQHQLKMHLDGARIFNAAVELKVPVAELCEDFDSVQFCFSKGLSAPVGSMIAGSAEFIAQARNNRQLVGGTMRQVGVIAAACIVALEQMVDRLAEDHANAKRLAEGLAEFPQIEIDPKGIETNIVFFKLRTSEIHAHDLAARLAEKAVLVIPFSNTEIRAVTHYGIESSDIDETLKAFKHVLKA